MVIPPAVVADGYTKSVLARMPACDRILSSRIIGTSDT